MEQHHHRCQRQPRKKEMTWKHREPTTVHGMMIQIQRIQNNRVMQRSTWNVLSVNVYFLLVFLTLHSSVAARRWHVVFLWRDMTGRPVGHSVWPLPPSWRWTPPPSPPPHPPQSSKFVHSQKNMGSFSVALFLKFFKEEKNSQCQSLEREWGD